jgi:hypothetical protein
MKNFNPTLHCMEVGKIIMNRKDRIDTAWGKKSQLGVADLIYRESGVGDLLKVVETAIHELRIRCGYKAGNSAFDELTQVFDRYNERVNIGRLGGIKK